MARPKTPEEMLAESLAGGSGFTPQGGIGTGTEYPTSSQPPTLPGPMYESPGGGPSAPVPPASPPTGPMYGSPSAPNDPTSPPVHSPFHSTAPVVPTAPLPGSPIGPIDPNAPGSGGPMPLGPLTSPTSVGAPPPAATTNVWSDAVAGQRSIQDPSLGTPGATTNSDAAMTNSPAGQRSGRRTSTDIAALWKQLTGRDATAQESGQWGNDIDENYYQAIQRQIAGTDEAKAYAARQQAPAAPAPTTAPATGGDANWLTTDFSNPENVKRYFQSRGVTPSDSSVAYWAQKFNSPEFAGDRQYFLKRLAGAEEFGGGVGGGEFNDPWGSALEGQTGQYSADARKRAADLAKVLRDRAAQLNQPAYTSGDEAVIRAKAFDQLERRRQETLKNGRESVYARGFAPTSGLVQDTQNKTNQTFEGARTGIESNLLQSSLDENNRRKDQAVQLEQLATQALNGGDLSAIQALSGPLSLMNTRQQTAGSLLNGSNSQSMNSILQILAMLQQNQGANNAQSGSQAAGYGALIPILIQALGGMS